MDNEERSIRRWQTLLFWIFMFIILAVPFLAVSAYYENFDFVEDQSSYLQSGWGKYEFIQVNSFIFLPYTIFILGLASREPGPCSRYWRLYLFILVSVVFMFLHIWLYATFYAYVGVCDAKGNELSWSTIMPEEDDKEWIFAFLYFSIVTWTTLGYGDLRPTEEARLIASTEALLGYVVMGLFLGSLIQQLWTLGKVKKSSKAKKWSLLQLWARLKS